MENRKFAVDERPYCVWDRDLSAKNMSLINMIDSGYFRYLALVHGRALQRVRQRQRAALSLRIAYAHALETFFAVLFAAVQAPDCVIGWLLKYEVRDLRSLIEKVRSRKPILSKIQFDSPTWESLSATLLAYISLQDKDKETRVKREFSVLWSRFANDLLDEGASQEYNSVKHGLRAKAGGFTWAIGRESEPGVRPPPEGMVSLGGSEFGASFYAPEGLPGGQMNFSLREYSLNWRPEKFHIGLQLIAYSLENVLGFLKIQNGAERKSLKFVWPKDEKDEAMFDEPWKLVSGGITNFSQSSIILDEDFRAFSKSEILDIYNGQ